jgi:hypothetical protein
VPQSVSQVQVVPTVPDSDLAKVMLGALTGARLLILGAGCEARSTLALGVCSWATVNPCGIGSSSLMTTRSALISKPSIG